jgi:hypothetical protein
MSRVAFTPVLAWCPFNEDAERQLEQYRAEHKAIEEQRVSGLLYVGHSAEINGAVAASFRIHLP